MESLATFQTYQDRGHSVLLTQQIYYLMVTEYQKHYAGHYVHRGLGQIRVQSSIEKSEI